MKIILFLSIFFILGSCTFPQDPEHSYEDAMENSLLVGVVDHPPYARYSRKGPMGSEVNLLQDFAKQEGLEIKFMGGSETRLINQLEQFKIHVVVGGFQENTIWKKKAGITTTYDGKHVLLIPKGENRLLQELEDYLLNRKGK